VNNLRSLMSATLLALALVAPAARAAEETPNPWKFEFHGFVTASMYYQDQVYSNGQGQGLLYAAPSPANSAPCVVTPASPCTAAGSATKSAGLISGDVRNSRFAFSMAGPKVFGDAQPRAYLEFDFFGQAGAGAFGTEQPLPRLRVGYAELKMGNTNIQVGQQNQLVVVQIPGSISHIANPVTYGAGTIGWRTPGVRVTQMIPVGDLKLELAVEAVKNKWSNEAVGAGVGVTQTPAVIGYGESSMLPMFQGRVKVDGKVGDFAYMAYLVGVYGKIDLNGFGDGATIPGWAAGKTSIDQNVVEVGGKLTFAPVSLSGQFYTGKNTANMLGGQLVFGDVKDTGYWVQLAGNITKELSVNVAYGNDKPDAADLRRVGGNTVRLDNTLMGGMIKYQDGGYALGVEYWTNSSTYSTTATTDHGTDAMQVIATAAYFF
jgi:hypothetical protein